MAISKKLHDELHEIGLQLHNALTQPNPLEHEAQKLIQELKQGTRPINAQEVSQLCQKYLCEDVHYNANLLQQVQNTINEMQSSESTEDRLFAHEFIDFLAKEQQLREAEQEKTAADQQAQLLEDDEHTAGISNTPKLFSFFSLKFLPESKQTDSVNTWQDLIKGQEQGKTREPVGHYSAQLLAERGQLGRA